LILSYAIVCHNMLILVWLPPLLHPRLKLT